MTALNQRGIERADRGGLGNRANPLAKIRAYRPSDYTSVARLWTEINRELAPESMRDLFEQYIAAALSGELRNAADLFARSKKNGLWVVLADSVIVGTFGIERRDADTTELRRMYLAASHRRRGIAQQMLEFAERKARDFGFNRMILSTAEVQKAAIRFYERCGYRLVRSELAGTMSTKQVGGGLMRFHFERDLRAPAANGVGNEAPSS